MTTISKNQTVINISISDLVLTPVSCALLVNEVMKNLLYQRSQIPYPYAWLKNVVNMKRQKEENGENIVKNFTLNRHYRIASTAYDSAENIMKSILKICKDFGEKLKEIVFVIGVTPVYPKEVITVRFTSIAYGHIERNHALENSKKQPKILRSIFLENNWMDLIETPLSCSNTYIYIKLSGIQDSNKLEDSIFVFSKPPSMPLSVKHTIIDFKYNKPEEYLCCDKLEIFKDTKDLSLDYKKHEMIQTKTQEFWLESKLVIQGFKDCFINKISACQLW